MANKRSQWLRLKHLLPALPTADRKEAARASLGAAVGIGCCTLLGLLLPLLWGLPLYLIAPLGASAVLVFAVPNSPLAQPWSAIVGNTVSGLVAIAVLLVAPPWLAPALAVGFAILLMLLTRSLHPPGGAVALLAAIERDGVLETGFVFAFSPVALMTITLVAAGIAFNRLTGRVYPFRQPKPPSPERQRLGLTNEELTKLLKRFNQSPNLGVADLGRLLAAAEEEAAQHRFDGISCADVMSQPLISCRPETLLTEIIDLFRAHSLKSLPVLTSEGALLGAVQQDEIINALAPDTTAAPLTAGQFMKREVSTALATAPVGSLLNRFTSNGVQSVVITEDAKALGILTRSDIIALLLSGAEERAPR
ncbi:CBS domain-containing protein [Henriciella barbarensis]|uniref:CBS domain-containing protein n=1 Tax=Henriciella barbarensis TaxID=86342 RepID=A0A399R4H8_9PROT|nr:HPP family protein [Henriciella barbarensis]RIJ24329.1 CBS domain-containing protein [Henriciella barbarensis]